MTVFMICIAVFVLFYIALKIYRRGKDNIIRRHGHCCDECIVKDKCDEYKQKHNM